MVQEEILAEMKVVAAEAKSIMDVTDKQSITGQRARILYLGLTRLFEDLEDFDHYHNPAEASAEAPTLGG